MDKHATLTSAMSDVEDGVDEVEAYYDARLRHYSYYLPTALVDIALRKVAESDGRSFALCVHHNVNRIGRLRLAQLLASFDTQDAYGWDTYNTI